MYSKEITPLEGLKNGYIQFRDWNHPLRYASDGSVYYHRHVASIKYARWIGTEEHVHHIDGNKLNNSPENLLVVSSSEHSLLHNPSQTYTCQYCNVKFTPHNKDSKYCSEYCYKNSTVKNKTISKELLEELLPSKTWRELGKLFGYSDTGIKKRAKSLGVDLNLAKNKHKA